MKRTRVAFLIQMALLLSSCRPSSTDVSSSKESSLKIVAKYFLQQRAPRRHSTYDNTAIGEQANLVPSLPAQPRRTKPTHAAPRLR
jgi:hypothetical protein